MCGGSIISPKYVLGAAHCIVYTCTTVFSPSNFVIVAGDLSLTNPTNNTVTRNVSAVYPHPDYNVLTIRHDIAVYEVRYKYFSDRSSILHKAFRNDANRVLMRLRK